MAATLLPKTGTQHGHAGRVLEFARKFGEVLNLREWKKSDAQGLVDQAVSLASVVHRVVVVGAGNTGKSSVSNILLGEKVWPVASCCMTSRICETSYGDTREHAEAGGARHTFTEGKGVPKGSVNKSSQSERDEFARMASTTLQAWLPSETLKPAVMHVDMPGFDQEKAYREAVRRYAGSHRDASHVVLVYMVDVKNKLLNSDREFLEFLAGSPWSSAARRMLLFVNKCDRPAEEDDESDEDEAAPDYEALINDITTEARNYCKPSVYRMSLKDAKNGHPDAVEAKNRAMRAIDDAVSKAKGHHVKGAAVSMDKAVREIGFKLAGEAQRQKELERQRAVVAEAKKELAEFEDGLPAAKAKLCEELRAKFNEARPQHRAAIERRTFTAEGERRTDENMAKFKEEVSHSIHVMVSQDVTSTVENSPTVQAAVGSMAVVLWPEGATGVLTACFAADAFLSLLAGEILLGFTALGLFVAAPLLIVVPVWFIWYPKITVDVKLKLFDEAYDQLLAEASVSNIAGSYLDRMGATFKGRIEQEERRLEKWEAAAEIDDPEMLAKYRAAYEALEAEWGELARAGLD